MYLRNGIFLKNTALTHVLTAVILTMAYPSALHLLFTKELIRPRSSYPKVEAYVEGLGSHDGQFGHGSGYGRCEGNIIYICRKWKSNAIKAAHAVTTSGDIGQMEFDVQFLWVTCHSYLRIQLLLVQESFFIYPSCHPNLLISVQ
jgi:hypothetical protein